LAGVIDGPTTAEVGALLTFTSHGASDPDGRPLTFSWSFGDGASASGQSVTHAFARTGTFVVTLTVDDGKATATVATSVVVQPSPRIVAGSISTTAAIVGIVVTLTSQGASDADGRPLTYSWDLGDGGTASGPSVTHVYSSSGSYNVGVTVTDGVQAASARATVVVRDLTGRWLGTIPPMPPNVMFSTDVILTQTGNSLTGVLPDQGFSPGTINGSIDPASGQITLFVSMGPDILFRFTGSASSDLNTLSGIVNGDGFINTPWTMRRQ
jgi:chitodextrinase